MELIIWTLLNLEKDLWIQNQKMGSLNDLTKAQVRPYHERLICFRQGNIPLTFPVFQYGDQTCSRYLVLAKIILGFHLFLTVCGVLWLEYLNLKF